MSETKKTIPIQDIWMFLWRLLFTPFVIALSLLLSIFVSCCILLLLVITETVAFIAAFVASTCGSRWLIKEWMKWVYNDLRETRGGQWSDENYLAIPTKWWKAVTSPGVRKSLVNTANALSATIWWASLAVAVVLAHPLETFWLVIIIMLGPFYLWGILWLVKVGLELLLRWIFQRPRPKPQPVAPSSHGVETLSDLP